MAHSRPEGVSESEQDFPAPDDETYGNNFCAHKWLADNNLGGVDLANKL